MSQYINYESSDTDDDLNSHINGISLDDPLLNESDNSNRPADLTSLCGKLCALCRQLDLSVSRFIVDAVQRQATNEVRNHYLRKSVPYAQPSVNPVFTTFELGHLGDLWQTARTCSFCELVKRGLPSNVGGALRDFEYLNVDTDNIDWLQCAKLSVTWELDGRACSRNNGMSSRTRRLHLKWSDERLGEAYVVFLPSNRFTQPASDAPSVHPNDSLFLGRPIDSTGKNRALMSSWLELCRNKHGGLCRAGLEPSDRFSQMVDSSYFGVIDVYSLRLTTLPRRDDGYEPYVALSYVWGSGKKYTTTLGNVMQHRTDGGLERAVRELPRAVQDAITLVPTLGLRYLWVDSLCIVQNSTRSWKLNAFNMDLIYGHATLTICAADGDDSKKDGLKAMHRNTHNTAQHTAEILQGFHLMLTHPPESAIQRSVWNSRAWTFQERLLSPRSLIFVDGRVYFQCRSTGMSEDIVADREGAGWSLDLVNAPLQILRQTESKPIWVYNKLVELYTRRNLTFKSDILAAFSGIYRMLESQMECPFVFGLPTSHFDLALLWQSENVIQRRKTSTGTTEELSELDGEFPSWSWCGWEGSSMSYDAETLDGVFRDTHTWLMDRTWITWYVRDGYGDLRPLWDYLKCKSSSATECRWKGYEASDGTDGGPRMEYDVESDPKRVKVQFEDEYYRLKKSNDHIPDPYYRSKKSNDDGSDDAWREYHSSNPNLRIHTVEKSRDLFGRKVDWDSNVTSSTREFCRTLQEFPYRVVRKPYQAVLETIEHPLKPILQFHTLYMRLNLVPEPELPQAGSKSSQLPTPPKLQRYSIADNNGDWCGSIVLDSSWFGRQQKRSKLRHEFIAISDALRFSDKECPIWTYYIPKEREESEWDVYYVLLIQYRVDTWKRVGLGKVFKEAFAGSEWKEIILG
jgi:hypothetical protein